MGVLNLTPDSFSDVGQNLDPASALSHIREMIADGAAVIDIGAESTRPGSQGVSDDEQIRRLLPVLRHLREFPVTFSIDTTRAAVAGVALDHGVTIINDISAGRDDPAMLPLAAARNCPIILMHMQGTPATMQLHPTYTDVIAEISAFLAERLHAATSAGIPAHHQLIDPGLGFGKALDHNLSILRNLSQFCALSRPIVVGASRKGFIGKLTKEPDPLRRTYGNAATTAWAATNRAALIRVHEVKPMRQVLDVIAALTEGDDHDLVLE
jgi:dihydropteroate synthase